MRLQDELEDKEEVYEQKLDKYIVRQVCLGPIVRPAPHTDTFILQSCIHRAYAGIQVSYAVEQVLYCAISLLGCPFISEIFPGGTQKCIATARDSGSVTMRPCPSMFDCPLPFPLSPMKYWYAIVEST